MDFLRSNPGSWLFFTPLVVVPAYLLVERGLRHHAWVQHVLKAVTVLGGLCLVGHALTTPLDFEVGVMGRPGMTNHGVPAPIFLVILGVALAALPLYSKYLEFKHSDD